MTDTTKRYRLKKDYVTPRFTYAKGADVAYLGGMYVIGIETFTEEALKSTPDWFEEVLVSEPVKEMVGVTVTEMNTYNSRVHYGYSFNVHSVDIDCGKIKQAIESALNDTVVEDRFDGKRASFYAMDEVGQWAAADKELTKEKIDELMKEFHNQPLQFYSPPKRYSQSEVDAIRADTWYAARKITDKVVGEIDFKDGDRCPFYEKYFNSINDYLSSLNLNSNDTGKEDNETKSANWRSENLSKQSAPEPSALPNKEWEIVSYKHKISEQVYDEKFNLELVKESFKDAVDIHSVRRLSDNVVLTAMDGNYGSTERRDGYPNKPIKKFFIKEGLMYAQFDEGHGNNDGCLPFTSIQKLPTPTQPEDNSDVAAISLNDIKKLFPHCTSYDMSLLEHLVKQKLNK